MKNPLELPIFKRISRLVDERGVEAYVVGGYVRDYYLHRPCTDIDVVVVGSGIEIAEALGKELKTKVSVFKTFGTVEALLDVSFSVEKGQTLVILGESGGGKTTICSLIPRFYDVTEGEILVDGINIKDVTQHDLREKIGYVPQKGVLFSGDIESNLKYGYNVMKICKKVQEKAKVAIENMTGLTVADINVRVAGIEVEESK